MSTKLPPDDPKIQWIERLAFCEAQQAIASDPAQQFQLFKAIEEARIKLAELDARSNIRSGLTVDDVDLDLLRDYFIQCSKYNSDFQGLIRLERTDILSFLCNRGLASWPSVGESALTEEGILFCAKCKSIPHYNLHVSTHLETIVFGRSFYRVFSGSVLYLRGALIENLKPLWERCMGDPKERDDFGGEQFVCEYPQTAVIEALTNFLIHRDYREDDHGIISIQNDRIEFINPGQSEWTPEELLTADVPLRPKYHRNARLIEVANLAGLNQKAGSGIQRIRAELLKNSSLRADGSIGLEIHNDTEKNRFHLIIYRRELGSRVAARRPDQPSSSLPAPYAGEKSLAEELDDARAEEERRLCAGDDTREVRARILDLRRRIRDGGSLCPGYDLHQGRFRLIERAGQGGFATIWKSLDRQLKRIVALKVLHPQYAHDGDRVERFFRGARKMADLEHPGIVRVYDSDLTDEGQRFFVMEYLPGGDLHRVVLNGSFGPDRALDLILDVGDALAYAHGQGVIHRDVKPANIVLDDDGRPRLTDFDLVRAADTTGGTRTSMMGTFVYAAPELMENPQEADVRADVFGLAMTAIFALHGRDLVPKDMLRRPEVFIGRLGIRESVRAVLLRAIEWDLEERYPSVESFCSALTKAWRSLAVPDGET